MKNKIGDRRERKKEAIRVKVVTETMKAFKKLGFHQITMEQIAERSDISKATLYKYFPVKEAIIAAYWQQEMQNTGEEFSMLMANNVTAKSRLIALLKFFMVRIMDNRELYDIYLRYRSQHIYDHPMNETLRSGAEKYVMAIILAGQENQEIRQDTPAQLLAGNFEMITVMQALIWLRQPDDFRLEENSSLLVDLFLNGSGKFSTLRGNNIP